MFEYQAYEFTQNKFRIYLIYHNRLSWADKISSNIQKRANRGMADYIGNFLLKR